jgi:hypothetical protein
LLNNQPGFNKELNSSAKAEKKNLFDPNLPAKAGGN